MEGNIKESPPFLLKNTAAGLGVGEALASPSEGWEVGAPAERDTGTSSTEITVADMDEPFLPLGAIS